MTRRQRECWPGLRSRAGSRRVDTPTDNFEGTPRQATDLAQAMSALLADPQARRLLHQTLVVLCTEFGRTPRINDNDGRDHHNKPFKCLPEWRYTGGLKGRRRSRPRGEWEI